MTRAVKIGEKWVGDGYPTYIVGEVGINHNGSLDIARQLIRESKSAGFDAVKFQKRTPELCVPLEQRGQMRDTPWGYITYMEYRQKVEFGLEQYLEIDDYCRELGIPWFASAWDEPSVDFLEQFKPVCYKVPSASLTDHTLLRYMRKTGRAVILSTGMSTPEEIRVAVAVLGEDNLVLAHATSAYPCDPDELNLKVIQNLRKDFACPIGYSGHEVGLVPTAIAVAMGACVVERHITLDRALWGSDQAASVEPQGMRQLVKYIRVTEQSLGSGVKQVYPSEMSQLKKLRRVVNS